MKVIRLQSGMWGLWDGHGLPDGDYATRAEAREALREEKALAAEKAKPTSGQKGD